MENLKSTTTAFTVLQFSLETGRDGQPTQRTKSCGVFSSVEEAFVSARLLAGREWSRQQRLVFPRTIATLARGDGGQAQRQHTDEESHGSAPVSCGPLPIDSLSRFARGFDTAARDRPIRDG